MKPDENEGKGAGPGGNERAVEEEPSLSPSHRRWYLLLAVILLAVIIAYLSWPKTAGPSLAGTWVNRALPSETLELDSNGTFRLHEYGLDVSGSWHVDGDMLKLEVFSSVVSAKIMGDQLLDQADGKVWVRKTQSSSPSKSTPSSTSTPKVGTTEPGWRVYWETVPYHYYGTGKLQLLQRGDNENIYKIRNLTDTLARIDGFSFNGYPANVYWRDTMEEVNFGYRGGGGAYMFLKPGENTREMVSPDNLLLFALVVVWIW